MLHGLIERQDMKRQQKEGSDDRGECAMELLRHNGREGDNEYAY